MIVFAILVIVVYIGMLSYLLWVVLSEIIESLQDVFVDTFGQLGNCMTTWCNSASTFIARKIMKGKDK